MRKKLVGILKKSDQNGAVVVLVAVALLLFVAMAALAIDIGHLLLVKNELQNAADAAALAGARMLYQDNGTAVNPGANQIAYATALRNNSEKTAVEVNADLANNRGDVQRGHWSFSARQFTPNASLAAVDLFNISTQDLDDPDPYTNRGFVNAIKVTVRRETTPAFSFFAQLFGYGDFTRSAEAVAYIGFAGTLQPGEVDQPIAICRDTVLDPNSGAYSCNIGRMINSGANVESNETGGWTDFNQDGPCSGGTNASIMDSLICGMGNPEPINLGNAMATNGGQISSAFASFTSCWEAATNKSSSWNITLPVVTCPGNNMGTCATVVGAVNLNIVWVTGEGEDPGYKQVPTQVDGWSWDGSTRQDLDGDGDIDGKDQWASFADYFNLRNVDGSPAPYQKKAIYFMPDCQYHEPAGVTGGENFGVLAQFPVLAD